MSEMKPGWTRVKFGEIAHCVNDRVDDPSAAGVDRYVGLEHLDPESLTIRRWGTPDDVESTKLRFRAGDIIFGKRRAYQRKLAVADFEGICSAHAMVVRARTQAILGGLLPFLMQSDEFMLRAQSISVGSLSPTINWETLESEQFKLPPLDDQPRALSALTSSWRHVEASVNLRDRLTEMRRAWLGNMAETLAATVTSVRLGDVLDGLPKSGSSAPERDSATGHYVLSLSALGENGYRGGELKAVEPTAAMHAASLVDGDLLISRSNTRERVGFVGRYVASEAAVSFPDTMMRLTPKNDRVSAEFLEMILQSAEMRRRIQTIAAGTSASMKKINKRNLLEIRLPVAAKENQDMIVESWQKLRRAEETSVARANEAATLHRCLLTLVFGE